MTPESLQGAGPGPGTLTPEKMAPRSATLFGRNLFRSMALWVFFLGFWRFFVFRLFSPPTEAEGPSGPQFLGGMVVAISRPASFWIRATKLMDVNEKANGPGVTPFRFLNVAVDWRPAIFISRDAFDCGDSPNAIF